MPGGKHEYFGTLTKVDKDEFICQGKWEGVEVQFSFFKNQQDWSKVIDAAAMFVKNRSR